ncbi:hypothetical protein SDC9_73349 [bioreactor metagenome]|uniref:Uncharacterized protein n=1 Tax=bioreactor metagenome TaxID=1076179 RepID=A0A644YL55_9ZZZZ
MPGRRTLRLTVAEFVTVGSVSHAAVTVTETSVRPGRSPRRMETVSPTPLTEATAVSPLVQAYS